MESENESENSNDKFQIGRISSRFGQQILAQSQTHNNYRYYEIFYHMAKFVHAPIIMLQLSELHFPEPVALIVIEFLSINSSIQFSISDQIMKDNNNTFEQQFFALNGLQHILESIIILAVQHPDIRKKYPIKQFEIIGCKQGNFDFSIFEI